jgi:hypothetical protein
MAKDTLTVWGLPLYEWRTRAALSQARQLLSMGCKPDDIEQWLFAGLEASAHRREVLHIVDRLREHSPRGIRALFSATVEGRARGRDGAARAAQHAVSAADAFARRLSTMLCGFDEEDDMDVRNYPIFEVGTWNGKTFSEDDLADIVANYETLKDVQRVPLKLGHNEEQPVTDGQPALGWLANLRKIGKQLVADFVDVPQIIKEAIAKRLYRAVSVELLLGVKHGGKEYRHVLDAVALLGCDQPAVSTLPDLQAYLASRSVFAADVPRLTFELEPPARRTQMSREEVEAVIFTKLRELVPHVYGELTAEQLFGATTQ